MFQKTILPVIGKKKPPELLFGGSNSPSQFETFKQSPPFLQPSPDVSQQGLMGVEGYSRSSAQKYQWSEYSVFLPDYGNPKPLGQPSASSTVSKKTKD